ncbi:hypothetical protein [Leptolyngbya sp. 7M]|uniref:hypothetical protein n=1 Tax=Leptolyngbya sp. 7M TaxID=2812896 RepID=UPI001B8BEA4F|nr:hypothetical protein [Leptolyngbya sp. 7M]QYO67867.1 hypothetical protein JVX88_14430 [Leptolyngbya sp. 7M]
MTLLPLSNVRKLQLFRGFRRSWLLGLSGVTLVGCLGNNLSWALPAATPAPAPAIAQSDPNTGFTGVQIPYTSVTPVNNRVNIRFINETGSPIDYQVIGDTQFRTLPGRSEMTLERLSVPTTFTFRRADNGFLQVTLHPNSPRGTLVMRVRETPDFATDRTSVYIDQGGQVYLN